MSSDDSFFKKIKDNSWSVFIFILIWGLYILIFILNIIPINGELILHSNIDLISLFAALSAISGILYSNYKSDKRTSEQLDFQRKQNEINLKNSNNQLIEELSRDKKENAVFALIEKIMDVINYDLEQGITTWNADINMIVEDFEESQKENEHLYFDFSPFVQAELYDYFIEIMNKPLFFNYLTPEIQKTIKLFNKEYYAEFSKFYKFLLIRFEGSLELLDKFNIQRFEFHIITDEDLPNDYFKFGNYIIRNKIDSYFFYPEYHNKEYVPSGKEDVIVKIDEEDFNKLEFLLNKISYLAYKESLKYGYLDLGDNY